MSFPRTMTLSVAYKINGKKNPTLISAQTLGLDELSNDQELKLPHNSFI